MKDTSKRTDRGTLSISSSFDILSDYIHRGRSQGAEAGLTLNGEVCFIISNFYHYSTLSRGVFLGLKNPRKSTFLFYS